MKTNTAVTAMIVAFVAMIGMTGFAAATVATYDSSVTLDNKDAANAYALTPCDGIGAVIEYNFAADLFEWSATGTVPASKAGDDYSLIYYADDKGRWINYGGDNPGAFIGTITTDSNGDFTTSGTTDLGMDLPHPSDWNINPDPDYCDYHNTFDDYDHCSGAKLWMVPSTSYTEPKVTTWDQGNFLFETDLITYTEDAGISIRDEFSCGCDAPVTIPIVISNAENVGSVDLILTYNENLVTVTVTDGEMDFTNFNSGTAGQVQILTHQGLNDGLSGEFVLANVEFTPIATGICDFEIDVTTFRDATPAVATMQYVTKAGAYDIHAYTSGDVNDDTFVDSGDLMYLEKHVLAMCGFEDINECAADVDNNGVVDGADVSYLASYLLGVPTYDLPAAPGCPCIT